MKTIFVLFLITSFNVLVNAENSAKALSSNKLLQSIETIQLKEFPNLGFVAVIQPDYEEVLIKVYDLEPGGNLKQVLFSQYLELPILFADRLEVETNNQNNVKDLKLLVSTGSKVSTYAIWFYNNKTGLFSQFAKEVIDEHK